MNNWQACALLTLLLPAVLIMSGCANWQSAKDAVINEATQANDADAEIKSKVGCSMRLNAWGRLEESQIQDGYFFACVPRDVAERYGLKITTGN